MGRCSCQPYATVPSTLGDMAVTARIADRSMEVGLAVFPTDSACNLEGLRNSPPLGFEQLHDTPPFKVVENPLRRAFVNAERFCQSFR